MSVSNPTDVEFVGDFDQLKADQSTSEKLENLTLLKKNSKNLSTSSAEETLEMTNPEITATSLNETVIEEHPDDLILKEDREKGRVKFSVYKNYFSFSGGFCFLGFVTFVMLIWIVTRMGSTFVVAAWCDNFNKENNFIYMSLYAGLAITSSFFTALRGHMLFSQNIKSCRVLHEKIIHRLLKAPVNEFYDRVPLGRILNRVSKDLDVVESSLPANIGSCLVRIFVVLGEIFMCFYATGVWVVFPLGLFCYTGYKIYVKYMLCNNELIRIESISKSPVLSFFNESLNGLSVIRAYKDQDRFADRIAYFLNENMKCKITLIAFETWFGERISLISLILVLTSAGFIIMVNTNAAIAGLVLSYVNLLLKTNIFFISIKEKK